MKCHDALNQCSPEILRQVLGFIFYTVEQEGIGGKMLVELGREGGDAKLERLVSSVLGACQTVQTHAHENFRDRGAVEEGGEGEISPAVCIL